MLTDEQAEQAVENQLRFFNNTYEKDKISYERRKRIRVQTPS
jgi:hypothetical protein